MKSDNPNGVQDMVMKKGIKFSLATLVVAGSLVGCGKAEETSGKDAKGNDNAKQELSGTIAQALQHFNLLQRKPERNLWRKIQTFLFKCKVAVVELELTK